jgi:hypothetical protein
MKKILSVFFLMLVVKTSWAQEDSKFKKFHFGLKAAPSLNWFKPDNNKQSNDGTKFAFGYGVMTEFNFTENYCFATGIEVNNVRGATRIAIAETGTGIPGELSQKLKLQYLTLPLTLKMKTNEIGMMKYFGQFGISNGVLLKSKTDYTATIASSSITKENEDYAKYTGLFRESLIVGLGVEYNLVGSTSAMFSINYDNGFTDVYGKQRRKQLDYPGKLTSKAIVFNIGVLF